MSSFRHNDRGRRNLERQACSARGPDLLLSLRGSVEALPRSNGVQAGIGLEDITELGPERVLLVLLSLSPSETRGM